ncbi:MAG: DUF11 domain-containing protein [Firmicutes bacterium]|nr:DUF11 domain-containing protein [Bacillota bacterium]
MFHKEQTEFEHHENADQATAKVGDIITYTIQMTNTGNAAAKNVVITDQLPKGLEIQAAVLDGISVSPYNGFIRGW